MTESQQPQNNAVFEHVIEGNPDGPTLVFIHGWPDNANLWRHQVKALGEDFRCVLVTWPNFGEQTVKAGGFDFPELVKQMVATIRQVQPEGKVSLVTHDWGAHLGYLLEKNHPDMFVKIAAFDVGGHIKPPNLKTTLMIMSYQWALIASWVVGGLTPPLGALMSKSVGKVVGVPGRQRALLRSRFNYPYFYLWRSMLLPWKQADRLGRCRPKCPILFLFGERKTMMFHSSQWLQIVADSGGGSVGISGAGHWLMETHADEVNQLLVEWFEDAP
jgi:pimeloyl-ACP methyl ester carboxylesterase